MKKMILALSILSSFSVFAYTPDFSVSRDNNNTVTLTITNKSEETQVCSYTLSWLENVLTYKKHYGRVVLVSNESGSVSVDNDPYAKLTKITAHVKCE
ncbi:hypothetical protein DOM21_05570 [Bacteriovorax stolpii]|uniref:hypothetical protein n=1 Tax=Bacteriovorax stolpii TaxID=960 RepID=UPI001158A232|nr:hypothetical protein [Bacteriovorax stolpii]QDK40933.1 hypothetical protein DOM21_05570 [Bacteriovorax stolpii]